MRFCSLTVNKTAEAYSKAISILFNHLSNYHYLLNKKKSYSSKFSKYMKLPYLGLLPSSAEAACALPKLPEKASLSWVSKSGGLVERVFHLCRVYSLFLAKTRMLSFSFSLLSSSGSLQSSSNTPHINSASKPFLSSQSLDLKKYFSVVTLRRMTYS